MGFPLDESFLLDAESELGARLPESYRSAMMQDNGGVLVRARELWWLHPVKDTSNRKRIKRTCNHILRETETRKTYGGWPINCVEIAQNGSGDALAFQKDGSEFSDDLFIFDHKTQELRPMKEIFGEMKKERN